MTGRRHDDQLDPLIAAARDAAAAAPLPRAATAAQLRTLILRAAAGPGRGGGRG